MTIVGICQLVVDAIIRHRTKVKQVVLPATEVYSEFAHLQALHRLHPDLVHINTCTPWEYVIATFAAR
ncbi:hypothetical protein QUB80_06415 [Chlorogloeopsis sp. ULAP01]|uniref:hypothetical protein n=1 Tax=Chlorogloeopsis sp. ULAP01 TaxID=3056483 RepID=UPI0025AA96F6|nr:hypothetical protein [Chlorogloeopsis sp. ULAP01]MDM9380334.1 hypothetical protein [Chlorogloeopsis sp. ULAP01]